MIDYNVALNTEVEVKSLARAVIAYYSDYSRSRREWRNEGQVKKVPLQEVKEMLHTRGGESLYKNYLQITNVAPPVDTHLTLDDVLIYLDLKEEQAVPTEDIVRAVRSNKSKLEEFLKTSTAAVRQRVADKALELRIKDMDKLRVIQDYTGLNLQSQIEMTEESGE